MDQASRPNFSARPIVVSFAASDPSGGAGVQADLLTLAACGCHPLSVLTAITAQNTLGVAAILPLDAGWVIEQARVLLADIRPAAVKIGVTGSVANIAAIATIVAAIVAEHPETPVILDPVLASGRGDAFAGAESIAALRELLLPLVTVLTPNSIEARRLAIPSLAADDALLAECAANLVACGCRHVLVTGTHESGREVVNTLYGAEGVVRSDAWERLAGEYHGSGCTLASALAAALAHGLPLAEAVRAAQDYTWQTLAGAFHPGSGQAIPDRFFGRAGGFCAAC